MIWFKIYVIHLKSNFEENNITMNTIQQKSLQPSHLNEPEVPTFFYFILGMILVFGSGVNAGEQNVNFNNPIPAEIMASEEDNNFIVGFTNISNANIEDVEVLLEMPVGVE